MALSTIKKIIFAILLCVSYSTTSMAQNLRTMPVDQRDSLLISIAKEVVLLNGPDWYRKYGEPIIERHEVPRELNSGRRYARRYFYTVTFLYDRTQERLHMDFAARVSIREDGVPVNVQFGNGLLISSPENDLRNVGEAVIPIPFRQADPIPIFDPNNPDPDQEPLNINEFIERGFVRSERGYWMRTRPDTPPAEAQQTIRRAQEELRQRQAEREREGNRDVDRGNRR